MRRLVSLLVSAVILGILYYRIDLFRLGSVLLQVDLFWLSVSILMFLPTTLLSAFRLKFIAPEKVGMRLEQALKLVLSASSMNAVLPSKMGDVVKGYFISERGQVALSSAFSLVVYEKACDLLALLLWCVLGLFFYPGDDLALPGIFASAAGGLILGVLALGSVRFTTFLFRIIALSAPGRFARALREVGDSWQEMQRYVTSRKSMAAGTAVISVIIWLAHLIQIWMFILALGGAVPFLNHLGLTPLALFAGLIPLTFAGIGTRDAALVYFYGSYMGPASAAALGILCTFRYVAPAVAGVPFLNSYLAGIGKGWTPSLFRGQASRLSGKPVE